MAGIELLRKLIIDNHLNEEKAPYLKIVKNADKYRAMYFNGDELLFETRGYLDSSAKQNSKKSIASIYEHLDQYTSREV